MFRRISPYAGFLVVLVLAAFPAACGPAAKPINVTHHLTFFTDASGILIINAKDTNGLLPVAACTVRLRGYTEADTKLSIHFSVSDQAKFEALRVSQDAAVITTIGTLVAGSLDAAGIPYDRAAIMQLDLNSYEWGRVLPER